MTRFADKSFTVPTWHPPTDCAHGWLDKRGACVFCGMGAPTPSETVAPSTGNGPPSHEPPKP